MQGLKNSDREKGLLFRELQGQLRDRWQHIDLFDEGDNDILVVPSLTLDQRELEKVDGANNYEERHLFSLIRPLKILSDLQSVPLIVFSQ